MSQYIPLTCLVERRALVFQWGDADRENAADWLDAVSGFLEGHRVQVTYAEIDHLSMQAGTKWV